jgi:hypothetical protein
VGASRRRCGPTVGRAVVLRAWSRGWAARLLPFGAISAARRAACRDQGSPDRDDFEGGGIATRPCIAIGRVILRGALEPSRETEPARTGGDPSGLFRAYFALGQRTRTLVHYRRRCKLHDGKSTGPRTAEGLARLTAASRERARSQPRDRWAGSRVRRSVTLSLRQSEVTPCNRSHQPPRASQRSTIGSRSQPQNGSPSTSTKGEPKTPLAIPSSETSFTRALIAGSAIPSDTSAA